MAHVLKVISINLYLAATIAFFVLSGRNIIDYATQSYVLSSDYVANVSICPISWIDKAKVKEEYLHHMLEYLAQGFLDPRLGTAKFRYNITDEYLDVKLKELEAADSNFSAMSYLNEVQIGCEDEILSCKMNDVERNSASCCSQRTSTLTNVGPCWTMYSGAPQRTPGPTGGASFILTPQEPNLNFIKNSLPVRGYLMYIDDAPALIRTTSVLVAEDMITYIQLKITKYELEDNCVDPDSYPAYKYVKNIDDGVKRTCVYDCVLDYILEACDCIPFTEQINEKFEPLFCTMDQTVTCVRPWVSEHGSDTSSVCELDCQQNCRFTEYEAKVETAAIHYQYMNTDAKRMKSWDEETDLLEKEASANKERTLAVFRIYYGDLGYLKVSQNLQISVYTLISNIGGQMGMWLGMSLLSMKDVMQYFFNRNQPEVKKRQRRHSYYK